MWSWVLATHVRIKIVIFHEWMQQSTFICSIWVFQWTKREIIVILLIFHAERASKGVHQPWVHFCDALFQWEKYRFLWFNPRPLIFVKSTRAQVIDLPRTGFRLGLLLLGKPTGLRAAPVCLDLLSLLKQTGAHPRKSYVQEKRAATQLSPLRPSSELLHPRWPPRRQRINTRKTTKTGKKTRMKTCEVSLAPF